MCNIYFLDCTFTWMTTTTHTRTLKSYCLLIYMSKQQHWDAWLLQHNCDPHHGEAMMKRIEVILCGLVVVQMKLEHPHQGKSVAHVRSCKETYIAT